MDRSIAWNNKFKSLDIYQLRNEQQEIILTNEKEVSLGFFEEKKKGRELGSVDAYVGCLSGAIMRDKYLEDIKTAGFQNIKVVDETTFPTELMTNDSIAKAIMKNLKITPEKVKDLAISVVSTKISATKPEYALVHVYLCQWGSRLLRHDFTFFFHKQMRRITIGEENDDGRCR